MPYQHGQSREGIGADEVEWNHDLLEYCECSIEDRVVSAFAARLKVRLQELNDQTELDYK